MGSCETWLLKTRGGGRFWRFRRRRNQITKAAMRAPNARLPTAAPTMVLVPGPDLAGAGATVDEVVGAEVVELGAAEED
jgi:hypothetical protein